MNRSSILSLLKNRVVLICALGYFVDVYDLVLFGIVRIASLKGIGIQDSDLLSSGTLLLNWQMAGLLVGGFAWGVLGDKYGRMRALYGSILIYSLANLANAFVTTLPLYAFLRFVAGFGLAGELGAAVTLVSESVPKTARGIGSAIIGLAGFVGAVCAATLGGLVSWQTSYIIGGVLGLGLLLARVKIGESQMFLTAQKKGTAAQSSILKILSSPSTMWKYLRCVFVGVPIWFVSGILMYFSPEFAKELGVQTSILAGQAILWNYMGSILGDPLAGLLSQKLQSRKNGLFAFFALGLILIPSFFFFLRNSTAEIFYFTCFLLGIANGYWTLFVTMTAEHFGTNIRATVTTSVPNVVRATVIPMSVLLLSLKGSIGSLSGALMIGMGSVILAILSLISLPETFSKDLNYVE